MDERLRGYGWVGVEWDKVSQVVVTLPGAPIVDVVLECF
jgi:hypothetical protein